MHLPPTPGYCHAPPLSLSPCQVTLAQGFNFTEFTTHGQERKYKPVGGLWGALLLSNTASLPAAPTACPQLQPPLVTSPVVMVAIPVVESLDPCV